jgi:hypothetical protein
MNLILLLLLAGDPATCPMHSRHAAEKSAAPATAHAHAHAVDARGDAVMGFSHEKTKHTFRILRDGGAIEVRANDAADAESIRRIREHLAVIEKDFSAGTFAKPEAIHGKVPDGAEVMKELGPSIDYEYEEIPRGGRVRITTRDPRALAAVHAFLRFQIADHRTGDSGEME